MNKKLVEWTDANVVWFEQITSTNDEARNKEYGQGSVIVADRQTKGRGQRGNTWHSAEGKNLTFSFVLEPTFLPVELQFLLSESVSLALVDMLKSHGIEAKIKWPNDIYVGDEKIAGILIENDICAGVLARTIVGIGLNVNQAEFRDDIPNPVSVFNILGRELDRMSVLEAFWSCFIRRYNELSQGEVDSLQTDYHDNLYLLDVVHTYKESNGLAVEGKIIEVKPTGALIIETTQGEKRGFLFKEIEF